MNILNQDFFAVEDGEIYPETFEAGTECPESLVEIAQSLGYLGDVVKSTPKPKSKKSDQA